MFPVLAGAASRTGLATCAVYTKEGSLVYTPLVRRVVMASGAEPGHRDARWARTLVFLVTKGIHVRVFAPQHAEAAESLGP